MEIEQAVIELCREAKKASRTLANAPTGTKDAALRRAAEGLRDARSQLLSANREDLAAGHQTGLTAALIDRLELTDQRIDGIANGLEAIALLPDPVGETIQRWRRPNGLDISQVRIPIGVIAVIYEARPNVTADAAGLCLKSGNAVVLKGGAEAFNTNRAIAQVVARSVEAAGLPGAAVQLIPTTDRKAVAALLARDDLIDVIVPRGGSSLIRAVTESTHIPVIQHYAGICHTYVDAHADIDMAVRICVNAKVQRPGVCNAMETLLVHESVAPVFLPILAAPLIEAGVELRGCERTRTILTDAKAATAEDWRTEYLDLILSVKIVGSLTEAIEFINTNGSGHSEAIVTDSYANSQQFLREVDSAAVYVNASTRFTDGYEFGFGAEVGISTNRLHARGPMGLKELTTYKYTILGNGQIRE